MDECSDQIKILRANDSSTQICVVVNNCMKSLCISDWRWTCSFFYKSNLVHSPGSKSFMQACSV